VHIGTAEAPHALDFVVLIHSSNILLSLTCQLVYIITTAVPYTNDCDDQYLVQSAVTSHEASLWTEFAISEDMVRSALWSDIGLHEDAIFTYDWVGIFKRRLAQTGPSHTLEISILALHRLSLPVIDVISGRAPDYVHLS